MLVNACSLSNPRSCAPYCTAARRSTTRALMKTSSVCHVGALLGNTTAKARGQGPRVMLVKWHVCSMCAAPQHYCKTLNSSMQRCINNRGTCIDKCNTHASVCVQLNCADCVLAATTLSLPTFAAGLQGAARGARLRVQKYCRHTFFSRRGRLSTSPTRVLSTPQHRVCPAPHTLVLVTSSQPLQPVPGPE